MGKFTDWITSLQSESSTNSASEPQSNSEQGDAESQHKLGVSNVNFRELERNVAEFSSWLFSKSTMEAARKLQPNPEQEDAEAQYQLWWLNAESQERDGIVLDIWNIREDAPPVIRLVRYLVAEAIKRHASYIHIEPYEKEFRVRYRVDGVLSEVMRPPHQLQNAVILCMKIMAKLDTAEKQLLQDGRIGVRVGDRRPDLWVSTIPTSYGEKVVIQILDLENVRTDRDNQ